MSNFEVGDRVVVAENNHPSQPSYIGKRGEVKSISNEVEYEVSVRFDGYISPCQFDSVELELEGVCDALSAPPVEEAPSEVSSFWDSKVDMSDEAVSHPSHYTSHPSGVECKDIIGHYGFFVGSAMKYLWRAGLKTESPVEDLRKAIKNIEFEIERLGGAVD